MSKYNVVVIFKRSTFIKRKVYFHGDYHFVLFTLMNSFEKQI